MSQEGSVSCSEISVTKLQDVSQSHITLDAYGSRWEQGSRDADTWASPVTDPCIDLHQCTLILN